MRNLIEFILEKLSYDGTTPKNKYELKSLIDKRIKENKDADLNDIDVSKVTDMSKLFTCDPHNIKIDKWNVSNVTNMDQMFYFCENFNCDLGNWKVKNEKSMKSMFMGCSKFEGKGLENWDVHNVQNMQSMFSLCNSLDCNLKDWNVLKVDNMMCMFNQCDSMKELPEWYTKDYL